MEFICALFVDFKEQEELKGKKAVVVQLADSHFSTTTLCQNLDEINIHGDYYNSFENSFTK